MEALFKRLDALPKWFIPVMSTCIMIALGLLYWSFLNSTLNPANATLETSEFYGTALQKPFKPEGIILEQSELGQIDLIETYANENKTLVIFFGFANCPDVCPTTLAQLARVYVDMGEPEDLQIAMVTVDPNHDTTEITQQYASGFHPSFIGFSGSQQQIASAAKKFFVGFKELPEEAGQFIHTESVVVIDKEGQMRLVYTGERLEHLPDDLKKL